MLKTDEMVRVLKIISIEAEPLDILSQRQESLGARKGTDRLSTCV